jgi:branched-chain amino acid transport system substrate-binding protein
VPNVAKTPLVGGQWQAGGDFPLDLVITSNSLFMDIPVSGETALKAWS